MNTTLQRLRRRLSVGSNPEAETTNKAYSINLPLLRETTNVAKRQSLLIEKLELCKQIFSFNAPTNIREKEAKRHTLLELVECVNSPQMANLKLFSEETLPLVIEMISVNLFRSLPPQVEDYDPEEDDPWLDPNWPHIQVVYEFLLRIVVSSDVNTKIAKRHGCIDQNFCVQLINLFLSEDPRERDYLKTILHRIYGKFMMHRSFIRKNIAYVFARFVGETGRHIGVGELLEILGSIINGFALPLKPEHVRFIKESLLPLHKPKSMALYHQQLTYCVTQYVEKDPHTAKIVIEHLITYWPWTVSQKQVMFIMELEEILEMVIEPVLLEIKEQLFDCISKCICSPHFQVGERALFLWNNDHLVNNGCLSRMYADDVFPLVLPALLSNTDEESAHWNATVSNLSNNVLKHYSESMTAFKYDQLLASCDLNSVKGIIDPGAKQREAEAEWDDALRPEQS